MVAAAIVGAAVVGVGSTAVGSSKAAKAQTNAANQANATQQHMYDQTRSDLMPFQTAGQDATNQLMARMGEFTSPMSMTQAQLEATPGYQFNMTQGLKSVNNAMGARGLLNSGAVMKGASGYATGLADSTYTNQFNMDQTLKQSNYNRLYGVAQMGENAAAQTGSYGTQTAAQIGQNTIGAGNAQAASYMATANGITNAANSIPNAMLTNQLISKMGGTGGTSGIYGGR